jgi:hypothetical protein
MPAMSPAPSFLRDWRSTTEYKRTKKKEIKRRREREEGMIADVRSWHAARRLDGSK